MTARKTAKRPAWLHNLERLLAEKALNPHQLSVQAGLNPTAVRDMLSGRARSPRYDTLQALARVLGTTPAWLMGDAAAQQALLQGSAQQAERLELLTEIIARLQETASAMNRVLTAQELASMATTLYQQLRDLPGPGGTRLDTQAQALVSYACMQRSQAMPRRTKNR